MERSSDHEGHALRRGPLLSQVVAYFACLDCRIVGLTSIAEWRDMTDWTEVDRINHADWIEDD